MSVLDPRIAKIENSKKIIIITHCASNFTTWVKKQNIRKEFFFVDTLNFYLQFL